jgi:hypothetical protein
MGQIGHNLNRTAAGEPRSELGTGLGTKSNQCVESSLFSM